MPVREGLARLEGVESVSERCNRAQGTGELRMREGRLVGPEVFARQIDEIRLGARLRGLEATVEGTLEKIDGRPHLRVSGSNELLALVPLTSKVQIDAIHRKPERPTREEQGAYKALAKSRNKASGLVRITGPLRNAKKGAGLVLEVRGFNQEKPAGTRKPPRQENRAFAPMK